MDSDYHTIYVYNECLQCKLMLRHGELKLQPKRKKTYHCPSCGSIYGNKFVIYARQGKQDKLFNAHLKEVNTRKKLIGMVAY